MRSRHADTFNHDEDAASYDADVRNAENPIRAAYVDVLDWVADRVSRSNGEPVVDLGIGTGNLARRLPVTTPVIGVDVSTRMMAIAGAKLSGRPVSFVHADLLAFFDAPPTFGALMSTYTLHHLEFDERARLFQALGACLFAGQRAVFGDLMFESWAERERLCDAYRLEGQTELVAAIESEFFWDVETDTRSLREAGFDVDVRRFSDLSWGMDAIKRG